MAAVYKFKPYNVGRWLIWSLFALVLLVAPGLTLSAQIGVWVLASVAMTVPPASRVLSDTLEANARVCLFDVAEAMMTRSNSSLSLVVS